jgi:hypothetical protein
MARTTVIIRLKLETNQVVQIPLGRVIGTDGGVVSNPRWARAMLRVQAGTLSAGEVKLQWSGFDGAEPQDLPTAVVLSAAAPASSDLISLVAMQTLLVAVKTAEAGVEVDVAVTVDDGE